MMGTVLGLRHQGKGHRHGYYHLEVRDQQEAGHNKLITRNTETPNGASATGNSKGAAMGANSDQPLLSLHLIFLVRKMGSSCIHPKGGSVGEINLTCKVLSMRLPHSSCPQIVIIIMVIFSKFLHQKHTHQWELIFASVLCGLGQAAFLTVLSFPI